MEGETPGGASGETRTRQQILAQALVEQTLIYVRMIKGWPRFRDPRYMRGNLPTVKSGPIKREES